MLALNSQADNLIFLHGFLGSPRDWDPFVFPGHFRHCITLPGHEFLPLPPRAPLLEQLLKLFYKQFKKRKVILIGYSLGGRLAMHFAQTFPECVKALIILSANPGLECPKQRKSRLQKDKKWAEHLLKEGLLAFIKKWQKQPLFNPLPPKILKRRNNHSPKELARILRELSPGALPSLWEHLPQFPFKTLFLFGQDDVNYYKIAKKVQNINSNITVDMIPHAKHAIHLENFTACREKIDQFINLRKKTC